MAAKLAVKPLPLCKYTKNLLKQGRPRNYPQWKIDLGNEVVSNFNKYPKILIFQYNALTSEEWKDFRCDMKRENVKIKVYPNKITQKFLDDTIYKNLSCLFCCDTAVAMCEDDVKLKPVLRYFKNHSRVELLGGKIDNTLMNRDQIEDYSKLPSLEQSRGELLQLLSMPTQQLTQLLQTNQSNLSVSLEQYIKQQTEENQ